MPGLRVNSPLALRRAKGAATACEQTAVSNSARCRCQAPLSARRSGRLPRRPPAEKGRRNTAGGGDDDR